MDGDIYALFEEPGGAAGGGGGGGGGGPGEALRRAIRKARDEAPPLAPVRDAQVSAPAGPRSSDEEESSSSSSGAESSESVVTTAMLDTPGNRKLLGAIAAKVNKKKAPAKKGGVPVITIGGGDPVPVSLTDMYNATRAKYAPVTYPDEATSSSASDSEGDDDDDDDGSGSDTSSASAAAHKSECFLCGWGDEFHDGIEAPLVTRLNGIFSAYYGKAENAAIAQMMHLYYMKKIYDPARGMPVLTQATALEHIEGLHTLEPRVALGELIRRYMRFLAVLENSVFYTNNGFNRHAMSAYNNCVKTLMALYNADMTKMNFYNAKLDIDLKHMGAFTQLMPLFTQRREKRGARRAREAAGGARAPSPKRARHDEASHSHSRSHGTKRPRDTTLELIAAAAAKRARREASADEPAPVADALAPPADQVLI